MTIDEKKEIRNYKIRKRNFLKRMESAQEVCASLGVNPLFEIARIALKAEKQGELKTAQQGWATIQEYLAPKYKAVDPAQQIERAAKSADLAELQRIKQAILSGSVIDTDYKEIEPADNNDTDFIAEALLRKD